LCFGSDVERPVRERENLIAAEMADRAVALHRACPDVVGQSAFAADEDGPAVADGRVDGERALQFQHHKNVTALGFAIFARSGVIRRPRTPSILLLSACGLVGPQFENQKPTLRSRNRNAFCGNGRS
jgi:hypothetical protein